MSNLRESGENYLENILILQKRTGEVRSVDLAREMDFSKPSVSRAVHLLEDQGMIKIQDDGRIVLTDKGEERANEIYAKHIFLTKFFLSIGVSEETAMNDACRIEHILSRESYEKWKEHVDKVFLASESEVPFNDDVIFDFNKRALEGEIEATH